MQRSEVASRLQSIRRLPDHSVVPKPRSDHTLTVLLLADDRPGHYHLSDGILAAARRLRPLNVVRLTVRRRVSGQLLALLAGSGLPPGMLLQVGYGVDFKTLPRADMIVSAGAETLAASIAAARLTGGSNIHYGSLRGFRPEAFSLALTSYAEHADGKRRVMTLKPSALGLPTGMRVRGNDASPQVGALLLGGPSGECRFRGDEWVALLDFVVATHKANGMIWRISNSRRTPDSVTEEIAARTRGTGAISTFIDVRTAGPGTLPLVLDGTDVVICTDDSSSMISECVSARLPIIGVSPQQQTLGAEEAGYRAFLMRNNWYRSVPICRLSFDRLCREVSTIRPMSEDPLDGLAALLRDRLPRVFAEA